MTGRLALLLLYIGVAGCDSQPRVEVAGELLLGEKLSDHGVVVFRGVPFAEPPVGDLRWQAPQSYVSRQERRDATEFAPACMQSMRILEWYRGLAETFGASRDVFEDLDTSEDCLYLNIWTPKLDEEASLPVMVYVHGGSNKSGWSFEPNYRGHVLASRGVILVSIAYRHGVFGFFSHPDLDGSRARANFGLWDQLAALRWIREHIESFGGDPDNVTMFGESSGAEDILALMAADEAEGLFHRTILQSTAGFGLVDVPTLASEQQRGLRIAEHFGFSGDGSLEQLRSVPAEELLLTYEALFPDYYHSPAVDNQLLTRPVWQAINDNDLIDISVIIGSNSDEWYSFTPDDADEADVAETIDTSRFLDSPGVRAEVHGESDPREEINRLANARDYVCPSQYLAAALDNAWVYYFSRIREGDGGAEMRAYHGAELPYVFGTHDDWLPTTQTDRELSALIMSYWTEFAKSGNPNREGLPDWPEFSSPDSRVMQFADDAATAAAPERLLCTVFRDSVSGR